MHPQQPQNMYVPQNAATNNSANLRTNQQATNGLYRPSQSNTAPRNHYLSNAAVYQQNMLLQQYSYPTARHPPYQQFQISQPFYSRNYFPYMYQIAAQPTQQRTATVSVSANVGVGNTISMPTCAVPGQTAAVNQAQLTLGVSTVPNVLQATANAAPVQPYGGAATIPNIPPGIQQNSRKARTCAVPIIDPKTNRSIFPNDDDKNVHVQNQESSYPDLIPQASPSVQQTSTSFESGQLIASPASSTSVPSPSSVTTNGNCETPINYQYIKEDPVLQHQQQHLQLQQQSPQPQQLPLQQQQQVQQQHLQHQLQQHQLQQQQLPQHPHQLSQQNQLQTPAPLLQQHQQPPEAAMQHLQQMQQQQSMQQVHHQQHHQLHQHQQHLNSQTMEPANQTPVVSAIADAPSVDIYPAQIPKCKNKRNQIVKEPTPSAASEEVTLKTNKAEGQNISRTDEISSSDVKCVQSNNETDNNLNEEETTNPSYLAEQEVPHIILQSSIVEESNMTTETATIPTSTEIITTNDLCPNEIIVDPVIIQEGQNTLVPRLSSELLQLSTTNDSTKDSSCLPGQPLKDMTGAASVNDIIPKDNVIIYNESQRTIHGDIDNINQLNNSANNIAPINVNDNNQCNEDTEVIGTTAIQQSKEEFTDNIAGPDTTTPNITAIASNIDNTTLKENNVEQVAERIEIIDENELEKTVTSCSIEIHSSENTEKETSNAVMHVGEVKVKEEENTTAKQDLIENKEECEKDAENKKILVLESTTTLPDNKVEKEERKSETNDMKHVNDTKHDNDVGNDVLTTTKQTKKIAATPNTTKVKTVNVLNTSKMEGDASKVVKTDNVESDNVRSLIEYSEGQWSPSNPSGEKRYKREQLVILREASASRAAYPSFKYSAVLPLILMPSFVQNNNNNNNNSNSNNSNNKKFQQMIGPVGTIRNGEQQSYMNNMMKFSMSGDSGISSSGSYYSRDSGKPMIHVNLSLHQDVKLNETDNAWRPRMLSKNNDKESSTEEKDKEEREKEELVRRVRGILNKLTPERFDALVKEFVSLEINTEAKVDAVMVMVYEKAIDEPNFAVSYARLCECLNDLIDVKVTVKNDNSDSDRVDSYFRRSLLDKLKNEFTQNILNVEAKETKLQPIREKIKNCTDPNKLLELEALLEDEERKIRRRSSGNVRFIGELFKKSIIRSNITYSCIEYLLERPDNEDMLECLCKLLCTVGEKLEKSCVSRYSNQCFSLERIINRMKDIAENKEGNKISSRVRFMLKDVIDLRNNKWQTTRKETPTTLDQIEKEVKNEQLNAQIQNYVALQGNGSSSGTKRDDRAGGSGYGSSSNNRNNEMNMSKRSHPHGNASGGGSGGNSGLTGGNTNSDGMWHVQTSKGVRLQTLDHSKFEHMQRIDNNTTRKTNGSLLQYAKSFTTSGQSNSFAALSSLDHGQSTSSSTNLGSSSSTSSSTLRNKGMFHKNSIEKDQFNDRGLLPNRTGSHSRGSRESSMSRGGQSARNMTSNSAYSMNKSASHSKYSTSSNSSMAATTSLSSSTTMSFNKRTNIATYASVSDNSGSDNSKNTGKQQTLNDTRNNKGPAQPPKAVFENPINVKQLEKVIREMVDGDINAIRIDNDLIKPINTIEKNQLCALLYYILTTFLHRKEVTSPYRRLLGSIVVYLIDNKHLSTEHVKIAYVKFLENVADIIVDVPKLWQYVFEFLGPSLAKDLITILDLSTEDLTEDCKRREFLKGYLQYSASNIGPKYTRTTWKKYNMKWSDYMPEECVDEFIRNNGFGYIENESSPFKPIIHGSKEAHYSNLKHHLNELLKTGSDADSITDYINGNISEVDEPFISSLTTTLCEFATYDQNGFKLDLNKFKNICVPILLKYINSNSEHELPCLNALVYLMNILEHPMGLLHSLFVQLYEAEIITRDTFKQWRDSKEQIQGKGVAVKNVNQFLNDILDNEISDN